MTWIDMWKVMALATLAIFISAFFFIRDCNAEGQWVLALYIKGDLKFTEYHPDERSCWRACDMYMASPDGAKSPDVVCLCGKNRRYRPRSDYGVLSTHARHEG